MQKQPTDGAERPNACIHMQPSELPCGHPIWALCSQRISGTGPVLACRLSPLLIIRCNPSFPAGVPCPHGEEARLHRLRKLIRGEENIGTEAPTVNFEI